MAREKFRILIIEDSLEDQNVYRTYLCGTDECDYDFVCVDSGQRGIDAFHNHEFDCILLDYQLPDMDGVKVLDRLADEPDRDLPLVMITGRGDESLAVNALKRGAADYIVKSNLTPENLFRATHNAIEKHRAFERARHLEKERNRALFRELEALKEIKREKERLAEFFEQIPTPIALLRSSGLLFEFANEPMRRLAQVNFSLADKLHPLSEVFGADLSRIAKMVYLSGKRFQANEFELHLDPQRPAAVEFFNITFEPHISRDSTVEGVIMMMADVTQMVRARMLIEESEHRARLSEDRFRQIAEIIPHMIWVTDPGGEPEYFNAAWLQYTGSTFSENIGQKWMDFIHPEDREQVRQLWSQALHRRDHFEATYRLRRASDQQYRWHISRGMPVTTPEGEVEKWYGSNADIHDQRTLTEDLRNSEQRLFIATQASKVGIWETDAHGQEFWRNSEYDRAVGLKSEIAYPSIFESFESVLLEDRPALEKTILQAIETQKSFEIEFRVLWPEQTLHWLRMRGGMDRTTNRVRLSGTVVDITDQKTREQDLQDARNVAVAANQTKTAFLANMSHEIRTPLNAIIGFTDLIASDGTRPEERSQYAETVQRNGRALMQIIDDILDLSKIEAGKLELQFDTADLRTLINDISVLFTPIAGAKGIDFQVEYDIAIPTGIRTDPTRVRQVLMNAVSNAIKFTEAGSVKLSIKQTGGNRGSQRWLTFSIADTGIGIADDQQIRLFQAFTQADASMTRKFGGTGLGLMLSRRLAKLLGGAFYLAKSRLGEGSVFELRIPLDVVGAPVEAGPVALSTDRSGSKGTQKLSGLKILAVDDSIDSRLLSRLYLERQGAVVDDVGSAQDALDTLAVTDYDAIVTDIQMPEMDGLEMTRELRGRGYRKPIIGLSAHIFQEDRARSLEAGLNYHVGKPIKSAELVDAILATLHRPRPEIEI